MYSTYNSRLMFQTKKNVNSCLVRLTGVADASISLKSG